MVEVKKTFKLNLLPLTNVKSEKLSELKEIYRKSCQLIVRKGEASDSRYNLHEKAYHEAREKFGLHSQIVADAIGQCHAVLNNDGKVGAVSIPFNVPRSGNLKETDRENPVIALSVLDGRIGLPIAQDGIWRRFKSHLDDGYKFTHFRLKSCDEGWRILVTLQKEFDTKNKYSAVVGVDVGVERLAAVSVVSANDKVLRQLYFGQDLGHKQRNICLRRKKLQSYADKGSRDAVQKLRKLKKYESNLTKTRCYQVAHEIVKLAKKFDACISIEDLTGLKDARGHRKSNRKTKRMPYHKFREAIESVAGQEGIAVLKVDPRNTSKTCYKCGKIGIRNGGYFKCPNCGHEVNADRNASVNVALRAGDNYPEHVPFSAQLPERNQTVNSGVFVHDGFGENGSAMFSIPDTSLAL